MDAYDLGLRLKGLREKYKLSQTQVATRLNLSRSAIATTMYLWVKYTTASRVYIHLVAKAVRIESAMG